MSRFNPLLLLFCLVAGCASPRPVSISSTSSEAAKRDTLPGSASLRAAATPESSTAPPRQLYLEWNWIPSGPIRFEVYHSTNLAGMTFAGGTNIPSGFTLLTNTSCTRNPIASDLAQDFFIVRAVNSVGVSDWNQ